MVAFPSMNCFCYLLWFQSYEVKCVTVQLGCFLPGVDLLALRFYLDMVVP